MKLQLLPQFDEQEKDGILPEGKCVALFPCMIKILCEWPLHCCPILTIDMRREKVVQDQVNLWKVQE